MVKELEVFKKRSLPFATKATLNRIAWSARSHAHNIIEKNMILRNAWTKKGVISKNATSLDMDSQQSEMGSVDDYMRVQELGGTKVKKGKHGVAIPTSFSTGQEGAIPRKKLPRGANRLKKIILRRQKLRNIKTKKQAVLVSVNVAVAKNRRFIFLDEDEGFKRAGIYKVVGGKKTSYGWPTGARLKMVYNLQNKSVRIPKNSWMLPAAKKAVSEGDLYWREALIFQLKRHRLYR